MNGIVFEDLSPAERPAPNRADVACFVGFVARRKAADGGSTVVPPVGATRVAADYPLYAWLESYGWTQRSYLPDGNGQIPMYGKRGAGQPPLSPPPWTRDDDQIESLLDVPVPIESWDLFDQLFAWEARPLLSTPPPDADAAPVATSYLGAAVRSFFAQGGRRCYVVRVGDPWPLDADTPTRQRALQQSFPGITGLPGFPVDPPSRDDRVTWSGVGHLFGLPDVSFVCFPDLADAVSSDRGFPKPPALPPPPIEVFVECSVDDPVTTPDVFVRGFSAPRATVDGYAAWAGALRATASLLQDPQNNLREVQLVAAVPLAARSAGETPPDADLLGFLSIDNPWLAGTLGVTGDSMASAFLQLAWPWVTTLGGPGLPEALEGPDGVLVGVLARNALTRGSFRSAAGLPLAEVSDIYPPLRGQDLQIPDAGLSLIQRISLLGPTPDGMQLLSDVTTFPGESYRPANVSRLVSAIVRAARTLGENLTFEPSGPRLWARIRASLSALLTQLWHDGALRGDSAGDAFDVRCDRTIMSQRDLDEGRVLVEIRFEAAATIEQIRVVLAMSEGTAALVRAA